MFAASFVESLAIRVRLIGGTEGSTGGSNAWYVSPAKWHFDVGA